MNYLQCELHIFKFTSMEHLYFIIITFPDQPRNHEVPGSIPGSTVGIFPEGEDSRGDHSLGRLVEIRFNPLTPNDDYSGRTAPPTSKRCILYIY